MKERYLYLDVTHGYSLGLIEDDGWLFYESSPNKINVKELHIHLFHKLSPLGLKFKDLEGLIYPAGPGSYTGLRIMEGLAHTFLLFKKQICTFYLHELPCLCGEEQGVWFANAFKGEMFIYFWGKNLQQPKLLKFSDALDYLKGQELLFSHELSLYPWIDEEGLGVVDTSAIIYQELPKLIIERKIFEMKESFYYRKLEEEFKVSFHG